MPSKSRPTISTTPLRGRRRRSTSPTWACSCRGARALKIWLSISFFGLHAFRAAIDRSLDLALTAERLVLSEDALELLSPATLGIVCFRRRGAPGDDEDAVAVCNAALVAAWEATGRGLVSSTKLHRRFAVRLCPMNHTLLRLGARVDLLAGDGGIGRADDLLAGEITVDGLASGDPDDERADPQRDQEDAGDDAALAKRVGHADSLGD